MKIYDRNPYAVYLDLHPKTFRAQIKDLYGKIDKLEKEAAELKQRVGGLESWMAKPCLVAFFEVSFKRLMGIGGGSASGGGDGSFSIYESIKNATEESVKKTGIPLSSWRAMQSFITSKPSRNQILHSDLPEESQIKASILHLGDKMKNDAFDGFILLKMKIYNSS